MNGLLAEAWWDRNAGAVGLAGLIAGSLIGLLGLIYAWTQRFLKTFDWEIMTSERILGKSALTERGLKVIWQGREVETPHIVTLELVNSGKREVRPDDFDGNLIIRTNGAEVVMAAVLGVRDTMRSHPDVHHVQGTTSCEVTPVLYNRGDFAIIQMLLEHGRDDKEIEISVECAIAGLTRPPRQRTPAGGLSFFDLLIIMLGAIGLVVSVLVLFFN